MKLTFFMLLALVFLSGCAVHAVDVKTITIQPQKNPVTVVVKSVATCQDFLIFFRVTQKVDVKSSDGQIAESIQ